MKRGDLQKALDLEWDRKEGMHAYHHSILIHIGIKESASQNSVERRRGYAIVCAVIKPQSVQ